MSTFQLYLLTRLDAFSQTFNVLSWGTFILTLITAVFGLFHKAQIYDISFEEAFKATKYSAIVFCIICFISCLIPNKKDMALIVAGKWATNSAEMQKLPENVVKVTNKFLEEYLKDDKK